MTTTCKHPFESFGPAPYRIVRVNEKIFCSPGEYPRAAGSCDVCLNTIRWAYTVRASNGVEFVTGCDCALKAGMTAVEIKAARREHRHNLFTESRAAERRARETAERAANLAKFGVSLTNAEIELATREGQAAAKAWLRNERVADAQYVGEVGKRARGLELLVERTHSFVTAFGTKVIWILRDRNGNQIVLKSCSPLGLDAPEGWQSVQSFDKYTNTYSSRWFRLDATVKEHSTYNGMKQTIIQRCKVTAILSGWLERE